MAGKQTVAGAAPGQAGPRPRVRNPWGQGDRLRAEILAAAARLLGEIGTVDGLTLRGVARAAGVAPASIYEHFADKSALMAALLAYVQEQVLDLLRHADAEARAAAGPPDPVGPVRAQLSAFCRYWLANPGHQRVLFAPHVREPGSPRNYATVRLLAAALADCQRAGRRLRLPAERAAVVLLVATYGRMAIVHAQPEENAEANVLQFADELIGLVIEQP
jgi:AcrR family transcriptional regulator